MLAFGKRRLREAEVSGNCNGMPISAVMAMRIWLLLPMAIIRLQRIPPGVKTLVLSSENGTILSRAITLIADISVTENPQKYIDTFSFRDVPQEFMLIDGTGLLDAYDYKYP